MSPSSSSQTLEDTLDEANETFVLTLDSANGGAAVNATLASTTMTVTDDDDPPTVRVADVSVAEGEDAVLAVTLSGAERARGLGLLGYGGRDGDGRGGLHRCCGAAR